VPDTDYVVNDVALTYLRERALAGPVIARLAEHPDKQFADPAAWQAHLERLGITALTVTPEPVQIATEGALWGSIQSHEFLREGVIVSDDAGQFAVGQHALCWVHAERPGVRRGRHLYRPPARRPPARRPTVRDDNHNGSHRHRPWRRAFAGPFRKLVGLSLVPQAIVCIDPPDTIG
jgi:hypothetical protein